MTLLRLILVAALSAALAQREAAPAWAAPIEKVVQVPFSGGSQTVLYLGPAAPRAIVILFAGGGGVLKIAANGRIGAGGNFLIRTRELWVEHGLGVVIPDAPAGYPNLLDRRTKAEYADAIAKLVTFAHSQANVPVWLAGTSQGTNAAANGASHLTQGEIAGVILTSSITRGGNRPPYTETVFDTPLDAISVPVLILSHSGDRCVRTPPADGARLKSALRGSPRSEVVLMQGGLPAKSDPCEAFSEHGFYGVESETVQRIVDWMNLR